VEIQARWWIPDDVIFANQLPHTATGKLLKMPLRNELGNHPWPEDAAKRS
jgi:fatty-acyl-CoA synthase